MVAPKGCKADIKKKGAAYWYCKDRTSRHVIETEPFYAPAPYGFSNESRIECGYDTTVGVWYCQECAVKVGLIW